MFSIPEYGWVVVRIGEFEDRASHLTSVPEDALNSCINAIENKKPLIIKFDAEGWCYTLFSNKDTLIVRTLDDEPEIYCVSISKNELIEEIYDDISNNVEAWSKWDFNENLHPQKRIVIEELLNRLSILI